MRETLITRKEAELQKKGIPACKEVKNRDFAWGAIRNDRKIEEIIEDTNKLIEISDAFKEYIKKRQELVTEYKAKDNKDKQQFVFINGFKDYKMKPGFKEKAKALDKKHKKEIDLYFERQKGLSNLANMQVKVETYTPSSIPEELNFLQYFAVSYWLENLEYGKNSVTYKKGDLLGIELLHTALTKRHYAKDETGKWNQINFEVSEEAIKQGLAKRENVILDNQTFIRKMAANLRSLIKAKLEVLEEKPYKDYFEIYDAEREDIIFKHVYVTTGGEIATQNGQYVMKDIEAFNKAIQQLQEKHKPILDAYDAWMEENHEVKNVHTFKIDDIPEMDGYLLGAIEKFIED